jgi:hypothetical protein
LRFQSFPRLRPVWLAAVMALGPIGASAVGAATIVVEDPYCTLIDAITAANTDTPTGGCPAGSGSDTIGLEHGKVYKLYAPYDSGAPTPTGATGLPEVVTPITIKGNGATIRREGKLAFRFFVVRGTAADLRLGDITLTRGRTGGRGGDRGGAILVLEGASLGVSASRLTENDAGEGEGGAIASEGGRVIVANSVISLNRAGQGGGIASVDKSSLSVHGTEISRNGAFGDQGGDQGGGGIYVEEAECEISDSTINQNWAEGSGGGLGSFFGLFACRITGTTISRNLAKSWGGGVYGGCAEIVNSTIVWNKSGLSGGGLYHVSLQQACVVTHSSIVLNRSESHGGGIATSSPIVLRRTLVVGNDSADDEGSDEVYDPGWVTTDDFNLFGYDGSSRSHGLSVGPRDIVPPRGVYASEVIEGSLKDNGGPTRTIALPAGSLAVDAVHEPCALETDQRGVSRPQPEGSRFCDIGAFELEPVIPHGCSPDTPSCSPR